MSRRYSLSACMTDEMSWRAATMRASSGRLMILGTTSAASTPRITITTMISIRVKPRARRARTERAGLAIWGVNLRIVGGPLGLNGWARTGGGRRAGFASQYNRRHMTVLWAAPSAPQRCLIRITVPEGGHPAGK
ncbi:hypothetical protein CNECB9_3800004 [Cupriavidus necator]|uniref:Uncharacterized protein n=1 Tax=Cupriavidus necator TaxID=106590 RepID=A0A1K0IJV7_CUPNE|nr:hypothetical protein CNECB9_3800004 [Cupriavidus necator]